MAKSPTKRKKHLAPDFSHLLTDEQRAAKEPKAPEPKKLSELPAWRILLAAALPTLLIVGVAVTLVVRSLTPDAPTVELGDADLDLPTTAPTAEPTLPDNPVTSPTGDPLAEEPATPVPVDPADSASPAATSATSTTPAPTPSSAAASEPSTATVPPAPPAPQATTAAPPAGNPPPQTAPVEPPESGQVPQAVVDDTNTAFEAWGRFASTGNVAALDDGFVIDGPQHRALVGTADDVQARARPDVVFTFEAAILDATAVNDTTWLLSVDATFHRNGDTVQEYRWNVEMRSDGSSWRLWTVDGRDDT